MSTLHFMPWCPIAKTCQAGEISIIPFVRGGQLPEIDEARTAQVTSILASYKNLEGRPVDKAALVKYGDKPILADLADQELAVMWDCLSLACFSGLAGRAYFEVLGPYCNSDCFIFYGQRFQDGPRFSAITYRRREGQTTDARVLERLTFSIPVHVSSIDQVVLDEALLSALVQYRVTAPEQEWFQWQNAISCFNHANSDSQSVPMQVEWVLLCSAFERLLKAKPDAKDVAEKFASVVAPANQVLVSQTKRRSLKWKEPAKELRYEWMREFYDVRGDFAHGKLVSRQPMAWKPLEHIVLGSIAFPLLVKCLLARAGRYTLGDNDYAEIDALQAFADEDFLEEPPSQRGSTDTWWSRHLLEAKRERLFRRIAAEFDHG